MTLCLVRAPEWMSQSRYGDDLWAPRSEVIERCACQVQRFPAGPLARSDSSFHPAYGQVEYEAVDRLTVRRRMDIWGRSCWSVGHHRRSWSPTTGAARHARTAATAYRSQPMSVRPSSEVRDAGWDHGDGWSR